jgi:hypothetical protein
MTKPLFYVIGDSHVTPFRWFYPFPLCHIGPSTAWGLMNDNSWTHSKERMFGIVDGMDKLRDYVITSFGEIDCRFHVYGRHVRSAGEIPVSEIIDKTIDRYGQFLLLLEKKRVRALVLGIPPASKEGNELNLPYYGDLKTRAAIHADFNQKLAYRCQEIQVPYLELLSKSRESSGAIAPEWTTDGVHLNGRVVPLVTDLINQELGVDIRYTDGNTEVNALMENNFFEYRGIQTKLASLAKYWMTGKW